MARTGHDDMPAAPIHERANPDGDQRVADRMSDRTAAYHPDGDYRDEGDEEFAGTPARLR